MEINGKHDSYKAGIVKSEETKHFNDAGKAKKTEETKKTQDVNRFRGIPMPQDEYVSSEKAGIKPSGLYYLGRDKEGRQKIFFEDIKKSDSAGKGKEINTNMKAESDGAGKPEETGTKPAAEQSKKPNAESGAAEKNKEADTKPAAEQSKKPNAESDAAEKNKEADTKPDNPEKAKKCTVNTDKVDREIKKLKEKKKLLEQQINAASDEKKIKVLKAKLAQINSELNRKDNDTYRRQNASVSE